jgi:hypothetical protein
MNESNDTYKVTVWTLFTINSGNKASLYGIYSTFHKALEAEEKHKREFPEDIGITLVKMIELDRDPMYIMLQLR